MIYKFKHIAVGGTFDLFHKGHEVFVLEAFSHASFVTIGITSDEMAQFWLKNNFEDFRYRKNAVMSFLRKNHLAGRVKVVQINNLYGTALKDQTIDSILVTKDSNAGAELINAERLKSGLVTLKVIQTTLLTGTDGKIISSSRIRNGEIDKNGFSYFHFLSSKNPFFLPDNLRVSLKKPFGQVIGNDKKNKSLIETIDETRSITIGDATTAKFLSFGKKPFLSIVDFKIQRMSAYYKLTDMGFDKKVVAILIKNAAGSIGKNLSETIYKCININSSNQVIRILGEEDLAVIPCVLLAPLGFNIFYGISNVGLIKVFVDSKTKFKFLKILEQFG